MDGLIALLAQSSYTPDHFSIFEKKNIPVILVDGPGENNLFSNVSIDNFKAGYLATRHLIEEGCTNILLVTGNLQNNTYAQRHQGYRHALEKAQLPYTPEQVIAQDLKEANGLQTANYILRMRNKPDGLFITDDLTAAVCMTALQQQGIRFPHDIAVVGFNDEVISRVVAPQLSTIRYAATEMGEIAAKRLIALLTGKNGHSPDKATIVHSELVIRGSSQRSPFPK